MTKVQDQIESLTQELNDLKRKVDPTFDYSPRERELAGNTKQALDIIHRLVPEAARMTPFSEGWYDTIDAAQSTINRSSMNLLNNTKTVRGVDGVMIRLTRAENAY